MVQEEEWSLTQFHDYVSHILSTVQRCLAEHLPLDSMLEQEAEAISIKSPELRVVYCNSAYQHTVCQDICTGGKPAEAYLHESLVPIARATDHIILAGSRRVLVDHVGVDSQGRAVLFRTEKQSLVGVDQANYAILGITHIQSQLESDWQESARYRQLLNYWSRFRQLDGSEREIAICLARGLSPAEVAELRGVSKRTIELHRTAILNRLGLSQPVDLIKLLVRLQENGLEDLKI